MLLRAARATLAGVAKTVESRVFDKGRVTMIGLL